jgi:hypothetical protein
MSRRSAYLVAAFLILAAVVLIWLVSRTAPPSSQGAAAAAADAPAPRQSLAADAVMLVSGSGKWTSEAVKITGRDGAVFDQILGIEFGPGPGAGQSNAPDAQAKLFTSSPTRGIPHLAEVNTSLGNGSFRDVRLQESNGVRTITITRAVDANDRNPAKTQRIYNRFWSVSFRYELENNVLKLKGFPTTNKVSWGVSEFIVPTEEITFKLAP